MTITRGDRGKAVAAARDCGDALRNSDSYTNDDLERARVICVEIAHNSPDYAKPDWFQRATQLALELARRDV